MLIGLRGLPAGDAAVAAHRRVEAVSGDIGRIVLLQLTRDRFVQPGSFENAVSVAPGIRHVTVTPLSSSSDRKANENESMKAFVPL